MNNEPVAWMGIRRHGETRVSIEKLANDDIPLYTHPVKQLSDEEIVLMYYHPDFRYEDGMLNYMKFARAIIKEITE